MEDNKEAPNNHIPKVSIGMPVYNGEKFMLLVKMVKRIKKKFGKKAILSGIVIRKIY